MILQKLQSLFLGTLRRQLIISVALVHALMMALFIADLTYRQRALLLERQTEQAIALSTSLATSSAGWLASNDLAGLQELADSQRRYPELQFAILLNKQGQVLAHTNRSLIGQYLQDLPAIIRQTTLCQNPSLVDVIVPAMISDRHVGWARVGIGQQEGSRKLAKITRDGIFYAFAAIFIGSLFAWLMGRRITGRLYLVQQTIDAVSSGNRSARSSIEGDDEAAVMSREFNTMLDRLEARDAELRVSEDRYRLVFENSPVSIWEEDFSEIKSFFDRLKTEGVHDIAAYLDQHPEAIQHCAERAHIVDLNRAALALHGATDKAELFAGLLKTFTTDSLVSFRQELICLWQGGTELVRDAEVKTLAGEPRQVTVHFSVCPGYEQSLAKVLVSLVDISGRKRAEDELHTLNNELEERVRERTAELAEKNEELQRMNKLFVGRELRMMELKDRVRELEKGSNSD